jgi:hypothetical protein
MIDRGILSSIYNTSIGITTALAKAINTSVGNFAATASLGYINIPVLSSVYNTSIGITSALSTAINTSVGNNFVTNVSLGLAFDKFSNASLGLAFNRLTDVSLGLAFSRFTNASLGNNVKYNPRLGVGLRNASGNLYDFTYVDTSAYLKVNDTTWLQWKFETTTLG